jgi:hypothetical protein
MPLQIDVSHYRSCAALCPHAALLRDRFHPITLTLRRRPFRLALTQPKEKS